MLSTKRDITATTSGFGERCVQVGEAGHPEIALFRNSARRYRHLSTRSPTAAGHVLCCTDHPTSLAHTKQCTTCRITRGIIFHRRHLRRIPPSRRAPLLGTSLCFLPTLRRIIAPLQLSLSSTTRYSRARAHRHQALAAEALRTLALGSRTVAGPEQIDRKSPRAGNF